MIYSIGVFIYEEVYMNLEMALREITKKPQSMVAQNGHGYPALKYTENLDKAIKWLVDRYNEGVLKVEGYDFQETVRRSRLDTYDRRRSNRGGKYDPKYDLDRYMCISDFCRKSNFGYRAAKRIAREAHAYYYDGKGTRAYVDIPKFFHFLDNKASIYRDKNSVNLTEAAQILGIEANEVKKLVENKKLKADVWENNGTRRYEVRLASIDIYLDSVKGAKNGKIDSHDS